MKMEQAKKASLYKWILKDMAKIDTAIVDNDSWIADGMYYYDVDVDRDYFLPVSRFEDFVLVRSRRNILNISMRTGAQIHSLQDLSKALENHLRAISPKIAGVKIVLAYHRNLFFEKVTTNDAEKAFNRIASSYKTFQWSDDYTWGPVIADSLSIEESLPLQDYMIHKLLELCGKNSLPVQIHTGIQEGNANNLSNAHPAQLVNLFLGYPEVKFDIFHGSYPYVKELGVLAKQFPNVYIDMCWLHVLSPHAASDALNDWLDSVPVGKIIGFGGDYAFAEGAYGHSRIARKTISMVLRKKIDAGEFSEDEAKNISQAILRDNPMRLLVNQSRTHHE